MAYPYDHATPEDKYWAADTDLEKAVAAIDERVQDYYDHVKAQPFLDLWRATNSACFSGFWNQGEIGVAGKQGELKTVDFNEVGNLRLHLLNMITSQRPAFEARTDTIDSKAMQQAPIGIAVCETAMRDKGLEDIAKLAADLMLRAGEAYVFKRWEPLAGPTYSSEPDVGQDGQSVMDEQGQPQMRPVPAGDVEFHAFHPLDVARDWTKSGDLPNRWYVPRYRVNKWDLAEQFPDLREKILGCPPVMEDTNTRRPILFDLGRRAIAKHCDDIWVYEALIDKAPATPEGRIIRYVSTDCVLFDGPFPYREMSLYRMCAQELEGTCFGYSLLWDLLAPQLALNAVASQITTAAANMMSAVWQPTGNDLDVSKVRNLMVLKGGTVPPQVLDLFKVPAELFKLLDMYIGAMERMSGINSIYRGEAAEGQKGLSGAAYALFAARAIEFGSSFQGAYNKALEKIASGVIADYQDMGQGEYLATIAGEGNGYRVQAFKAQDLNHVSRVTVRTTNPMQATTAGRMQLFEALAGIPGAIATPAQALELINTGKITPTTQSTERELENIAKENEKLGKGQPVSALITDRHWMHIPEHMGVASSPEARDNPQLIQAIQDHVEQHSQLLKQLDPAIALTMGCPPPLVQALAMSMAPPPGATPGPGRPPGAGPGPEPGPPPSASLGPTPPGAAGVPGQPNMPNQPKNPLTGEPVPAAAAPA
jgi:hypothetical protein